MTRARSRRAKRSGLLEASLFHMRQGDVFETVRRLARRLDSEGLDYAIVGGLAVAENGYVRATEDVDVLMRPEDLAAFRERAVGRGYLPGFPGAVKTFRDTETGVRIEVVTTGDYPGDGKPKPVAFPDPAAVAIDGEDFRYVRLETLIELKLASGTSAPHRIRDLADVQDLIVVLKLERAVADRLDPSVRAAYDRLWEQAQTVPPPQ